MLQKILESLENSSRLQFSIVQPNGSLNSIAFEKIHQDVVAAISHLKSLGVRPRDCVGIYGDNCYAWIVMDLALITLDCVSIAIPTDAMAPSLLEESLSTYGLTLLVEVGPRGRQSSEKSKGVIFLSEELKFSDVQLCCGSDKEIPSDVF